MSVRIPCPYCGPRDLVEFAHGGDADCVRPAVDDADPDAWHDYVFLRDNPAGPHREHWQHVHGCRAWLVVTRDTVTHEVHDAVPARAVARRASAARGGGR